MFGRIYAVHELQLYKLLCKKSSEENKKITMNQDKSDLKIWRNRKSVRTRTMELSVFCHVAAHNASSNDHDKFQSQLSVSPPYKTVSDNFDSDACQTRI